MKSMLFVLFASLVIGTAAQADGQRVLVVMKSAQTFKAMDRTFKKRGEFILNGVHLGLAPELSMPSINAKVQDTLSNINVLVLSVNDEAEITKLKNDSNVAIVEKEIFHPAPRLFKGRLASGDGFWSRPTRASGQTPWGITSVRAPQAWAQSAQGAASRVLVLDTGIDREHPSLRANYEKGKNFVGDVNLPYEEADHDGHGTHVSGTIAGVQDVLGFTGVAPKAKLLMGRVCSEDGCSNIAVTQGINWGIQQGVDVISMSLGGSWSTPAEKVAVAAADQAGIVVVAASGNGGTGNVSFPAALPTVIAVGAVDSDLNKADFSQYGPELAVVAPGVSILSSVPMGSGREPEVTININGSARVVRSATFNGSREVSIKESNTLVDSGLGKPSDFAKVNVQGKYALISRGEIGFGDKVKNAIAAGATGAIIYNNVPGLLNGALTQDGSTLNAAVFLVERSVGQELVNALAAGKYTSATVVVNNTNYSEFDGTSMATPHVAGVAALIKSANKNLTPADVKNILQMTAQPLGPNANNEFGAGLVNAEAAVARAAALKMTYP